MRERHAAGLGTPEHMLDYNSRPARALATSSIQYSNSRGRVKERYAKVESRTENESESVDFVSQLFFGIVTGDEKRNFYPFVFSFPHYEVSLLPRGGSPRTIFLFIPSPRRVDDDLDSKTLIFQHNGAAGGSPVDLP
ncbi:hypothetical protein EVAR_94333_1 [Eumeta japonica]|uniref:Uncharacterized protein n=1 Tax=Eumeta variegata TaxID=151549 RepID=A0A4C1TPU2_EUMVA|nr:hypothetical protein EVAR_94333_1 [Eumeta japonica]